MMHSSGTASRSVAANLLSMVGRAAFDEDEGNVSLHLVFITVQLTHQGVSFKHVFGGNLEG